MEEAERITVDGRQSADHLCVLIHGSAACFVLVFASVDVLTVQKALGQPKSSILPRILSSRQTLGGEAAYTPIQDKLRHLVSPGIISLLSTSNILKVPTMELIWEPSE